MTRLSNISVSLFQKHRKRMKSTQKKL